jgi:hypothetical protein
MARLRFGPRALTVTGLVMFLVGGLLVAPVALAAASGPSIKVVPHARLKQGHHVVVTGTGFIHLSHGALLECNTADGEPTDLVPVHGVLHAVGVGCTPPLSTTTSTWGRLGPVTLTVETGTIGAADPGVDSAGNAASADAASYPCPPTPSQEIEGVTCAFEFIDNKGQTATGAVSFNPPTTPTTTTSTTSTTTTVTIPPGCNPVSVTDSGVNTSVTPNTTPTITMNPGTCIVDGIVVTLTGTQLVRDVPGTFLECNSDPNQPTVDSLGSPIPVSCTDPLGGTQGPGVVTTSATGTLGPDHFTIDTGTVGPPCGPSSCPGTDSAGGNPVTDAASYPCPPTPAEQSAGDVCQIVFGDEADDAVDVPITFAPTTPPCQPQPVSATASPPDGAATLTVDPGTCLEGGTVTSVSAAGLMPFNDVSNDVGHVLECSDDPAQPTISASGEAVPVSCTSLADGFIPNAAGTLTTNFTIVVGVTGPPASGTDSAGNPASVDAALYPCPPTPAQLAAGVTCVLAVADSGGDDVAVPLAWNPL